MKGQRINIIKAVFLLIVFSLNTIVGFACSIGIDLGYNSSHHGFDAAFAPERVESTQPVHKHSHAAPHHKHDHHQDAGANGKATNTKDDCCANDVTKLIQLDKSVVKTNFNLQMPVFFVAFASLFMQRSLNDRFIIRLHRLSHRRSCSVYDTDIRIAIQSFQI